MSRYIDADKLYELIRTNDYRLATINGSIDYGMFTIGIKQAIDEIPTADVAEVKHGEWKLCYEDWRKQIAGDECSVCGFQHFGVSISHYHYCPRCGARMDGGDFDEMPNIKSKE